MVDGDFYRHQLEPRMRSTKWVICADVAAAVTDGVARLKRIGAPRPLVIAGAAGAGPIPGPDDAEVVIIGTSGQTIVHAMRAFQRALADPPPHVVDAVERWDPTGEAVVLGNFLIVGDRILGRPVYGGGRREWAALEDKMIASDLWERSGIPQAPSEIVPARRDAILDAVRRLGNDAGAVAVADNSEGWHGGTEYVRRFGPDTNHEDTVAFFEAHAERVRLMPYLEGIPCSIHGMVLPDHVLAFRPCEMLVYRVSGDDSFHYASISTTWDPPGAGRVEMRQAARAVGAVLREDVGYRGGFGIDGVMTSDGFRPTELNPRFSAGLILQAGAAGIDLWDVNRAVIEGDSFDVRPDELEAAIVAGADARRSARCVTVVHTVAPDETDRRHVTWRGSGWAEVGEADADATLMLGPHAMGGIVMLRLTDGHRIPSGPSFAPIAAQALGLADEMWNTGIGELIPARDLS